MKICVVGAGAIGGYLAAKLARSGHDVSVVIRGPNLQAVRENGLKLIMADGAEEVAQVRATARIEELGPQDIVILGMKAHQVPAVAKEIGSLLHDDTVIVTAQNGVPWWYFLKGGGPYEGRRVEAVDPGGAVSSHIDADRVIGAVVYPACEMQAPGVVQHIEGNRFTLGELDGADTSRVRMVADTFRKAGFKSPVTSDIRAEIWLKLWGNVTFNPISALTHATLVDICEFPLTQALAIQMMSEARAIGEKLGVPFKVSLEQRLAGAAAVGKHKTSMLQDVEAGRQIELNALVAAVVELGAIADVPVPAISNVHALASLLATTLQAQKGRLAISS